MSSAPTRRRSRARHSAVLHKPSGTFHPRVQHVGPEHFGIVSVDCAKARCKWMLADFFGFFRFWVRDPRKGRARLLPSRGSGSAGASPSPERPHLKPEEPFFGTSVVPPTVVEHNRAALEAMIAQVQAAVAAHGLQDLLVAVERTGRYHRLVQRAFTAAGFEVRIVHPFATKQFRQASDPGYKTDGTDLAALHRAAVNGCALIEASLDETWKTCQLLIRQRRDLVFKTSLVCCQIREHLDAALPGFAACFDKLWDSACAWHLVRHFRSPQEIHAAGLEGLCRSLEEAQIRFQRRTLVRVLDWASQAAPPDLAAAQHQRIALALDEDRTRKTQEIRGLERELAGHLAATPYVLLLSFTGSNVVRAADFAGAMGPIAHYANARAITGRAGLPPSRYQSDQVDKANGPLIRNCNRKLRAAILGIADNLVCCNHHCSALAKRSLRCGQRPAPYPHQGRLALLPHRLPDGGRPPGLPPSGLARTPLHPGQAERLPPREHDSPVAIVLRDLQAALTQLPPQEHPAEAKPLHEELERIHAGRRRGPQLLGDMLPIVLARLGVGAVPSGTSGEEPSR